MNDTRKGADPYGKVGERTSEHRGNLPLIIIGAVVAVVVAIGAVVFLWPEGDDGDDAAGGTGAAAAADATQERATVVIAGEDLPTFPDSPDDPAIGMQMPKVTGQSFDESEVVFDPDDGEPKVIMFLAHWCPVCQEEVPLIQEWIDAGNAPEGVELYSVATSVDETRPNYPPSRWLNREAWVPRVLLDDDAQSTAQAYGLTGFPFFVFVDAQGNVVQRASGKIPIEEFSRLVENLASGSDDVTVVTEAPATPSPDAPADAPVPDVSTP